MVVSGQSFHGAFPPSLTKDITKCTPGACMGGTSGDTNQFGGFSKNETAALGRPGWGGEKVVDQGCTDLRVCILCLRQVKGEAK